jgi:peptide/nickel transport system permease protein
VTGFLVRRLANYLLLCFVAVFIAYTLASLSFDPLAQFAERNPRPPQSAVDAKARELLLDQPLLVRFFSWFGGVLQGDFGQTITNQAVTEELWRRAGVSLRLFAIGTVLGIVIGVFVGVLSAVRQYKISDYVATLASFVVLATPIFVLGPLLKSGALALNGSALPDNWLQFDGEYTEGFTGGFGAQLLDRIKHLIVPSIAIALTQIAYFSRYQRNAMLDVLGSEFLRTAQAKGLTRRRAFFKHGLRTALIPMATLFAFGFGLLIVGGVFTERIFSWPGMGDWLIYGITSQDTILVASVTMFVAVCVLVSGWLSDVFYAALDPRVRI